MNTETPQPFKPKLTRKQAAFVKELIDNPKQSGTQAAMKTYGKPDKPTTYQTAAQIAYENLNKPDIVMALGNHIALAESAIVGTIGDWKEEDNSRKREIALDAAKYLHDKVTGKATQRIEQTSNTVTINIDLSQPTE